METETENKFWVVSVSDMSTNRMSLGDCNGITPIVEELVYIVDECPITNLSHEECEDGWLGQTNDISETSHGGFPTRKLAEDYIIKEMKGRPLTDVLDSVEDYQEDAYTLAEYDTYYMLGDYMYCGDEPDVEGLSDEEIAELAEKIETEAADSGIGLCGDVYDYLIEQRDRENAE